MPNDQNQIVVRFSEDQIGAIKREAKSFDLTVSQWIRKTVLASLFTESNEHSPPMQGFYRDSIKYNKMERNE